MVKGVNRQVLEIHDTGTEYFEKAMFFVKPEYSTMSEGKLYEKAGFAMRGLSAVPETRKGKNKNKLMLIAKLGAAASVGAAVTAMIK